ncbi:TPA: DUF2129 domain-containing protein [Staphylococcus aureus]|nr:DUF2129 domain-containing protein [Staphylococcus aureus]HDF6604479.1 DUF2129 domain-containing protein [Staphylococcus aureus]
MNLIPRTSIVVYLKHMKHERQIRKYGHIVHSNRDRKFVIMYVNEQDVDQIVHKLMQLKYVRHIDGSPYKYLKKTYEKEKHEINN